MSGQLTMAHKNRFVDMTGQRFGKLVVIKRAENNKSGAAMWLCQCDCGNEKIVSGGSLRSGGTKSCGCIQAIDLIGQRFGQLTVLEREENTPGNTIWRCRCDCGNETIVSGSNLQSGHIQTCGCSKKLEDLTGERFGNLIIVKRVENNKHGKPRFLCKCDCGNEAIVSREYLLKSPIKSCGCTRFGDLNGQKFGKLTVLKRDDNGKPDSAQWICRCECGNETVVYAHALRSGHVRSCGCLQKGEDARTSKESKKEATFNRILAQYIKHAKEAEREFLLTKEEFRELISSNCYYCGRSPSQVARHRHTTIQYTGIDRIDNSKGYTLDNVRPCCKWCNVAKLNTSEEEFLLKIKAIYEHLNLKSRTFDVECELTKITNE